jgi:hypothetical protein
MLAGAPSAVVHAVWWYSAKEAGVSPAMDLPDAHNAMTAVDNIAYREDIALPRPWTFARRDAPARRIGSSSIPSNDIIGHEGLTRKTGRIALDRA